MPLVVEVAYDDGRAGAGVTVRFTAAEPVALQLHASVAATPDSAIQVSDLIATIGSTRLALRAGPHAPSSTASRTTPALIE